MKISSYFGVPCIVDPDPDLIERLAKTMLVVVGDEVYGPPELVRQVRALQNIKTECCG